MKGGNLSMMLLLLLASQSTSDTSLAEFLLALALPLLLLLPLFFVIRWQIKLFNDVKDSMHRIADAIETIAQRR